MMETNKLNTKILSSLGQGGSIFGITLLDLMKEREDIVVLSADMSTPAGLDKFKSLYANHFFNLGIAEQNMIGVAAGLMDEGYKTISVAQACFISMRCFEPVRQFLGYMHSKQVLVGIGSGFSLTFMGNTHYALEDIALMRSIPGMDRDSTFRCFASDESFGSSDAEGWTGLYQATRGSGFAYRV